MWAYGQHFRITHDTALARRLYPSIQKGVDWLHRARQKDPLHIMLVTTPGDNEDISGHVTGHNFWALAGLKNITVPAGGYMPPGLDSTGRQDWGNMMAVYPEIILDRFDPTVTATLEQTRAKYQGGIMTYSDGRWLHHYLTMKNTKTELIRGDQERAINEFYAVLVRTSATHAGFELAIFPWGTRDFGMNLAPHGWFAATYRSLVRNMLVREEARQLHLFSCLSPEWVKEGEKVSVQRAPTNFGMVNAEISFRRDGAAVKLQNTFTTAPDEIILHFPWFMKVQFVRAEGSALQP